LNGRRLARRTLTAALLLAAFWHSAACGGASGESDEAYDAGSAAVLARRWAAFSGNQQGRVVFARPPGMFRLDLHSGIEKQIPGVEVAGAPGRRLRGQSPRPSWAPDGKRFAYRFNARVYVCDLEGRKRPVINPRMDCSDETRWSWHRFRGSDWLAGPSLQGDVILVSISDPAVVRTAHAGGDVKKHCEITGSGRFVVYDDGARIRVAPFGGKGGGMAISSGQSCRPCASPDDRAAWLPSPHDRYRIYSASSGGFLGDLLAPPGEDMYRLNWSNRPDFAVHADGAGAAPRMHARRVSSGAHLFIGNGWDPDLWVGPPDAAR